LDLIKTVRETIDTHALLPAGETIVVGVSGGPDSLCLLHVLQTLAPRYRVSLHVGHLEHGIRGQESLDDAVFVRDTCEAWEVPVSVERLDVPALAGRRGIAIEEAARQARYRFLSDLARSHHSHTIAVGHNADDQVETVLMHFLRGSGIAGLRGMRPSSRVEELRLGDEAGKQHIGPGIRLIRPLLYVPRPDIERYCADQDLHPRFDRSNLDTTYYRNRLRHELIACLETYNPNIREVLRRTAEIMAGDYEVLREQLKAAWREVVLRESKDAILVDLPLLRQLPDGLVRSILREGVHRLRHSLRNINWVHVNDALKVVRQGRTGAAATLPSGLALRLGYDTALMAAEDAPWPSRPRPEIGSDPVSVRVPGNTPIGDSGWTLHIAVMERDNLPGGWDTVSHPHTAYLDADRLREAPVLRSRQPGDWLVPLGMQGRRQRLGDLMINVKVPRHERASVPLLVSGGDIAWVVGHRLDERFAVTESTRRVCIVRAIPPAAEERETTDAS